MTSEKNSYSSIFKSTFLFAFVQVFNIITKVGINKAVAVFLGTDGMGIIGLYQSVINILKTVFDLGISQSAVRDVSKSLNKGEYKYERVISITKKIVFCLALLGALFMLVFARYISKITFDNFNFTYPIMWLSVVLFLNILTEGQLSILKGSRLLKSLAKASLYGSVVGLFTSVPFYYFLGYDGIVPSLITSAFSAFIFSYYFISKIKVSKVKVTIKESFEEGSVMIKMGIALMYVNLLIFLSDYIIRSYINSISNLEMVGLFQAGSMIVTSYFGIIITALTTDYYPRISAIHDDNKQVSIEFNKQVEVSLLIIGPLVIFFIFAMPFFIKILYTQKFLPVIDYLEYAVFGVLITICSNCMGFILLAKRASKIFFFTATFGRIVITLLNIYFFALWGLKGLGIATILSALMHLILMQSVIWKMYNIKVSKTIVLSFLILLILTTVAFFVKNIENLTCRYLIGFVLIALSLVHTYVVMKKNMDINIVSIIKSKMKKK